MYSVLQVYRTQHDLMTCRPCKRLLERLHYIQFSLHQSDGRTWMMLMSSQFHIQQHSGQWVHYSSAQRRQSVCVCMWEGGWAWQAAVSLPSSIDQSLTLSLSLRIIASVPQIQFHSEWLAVTWPEQTWAERLSARLKLKQKHCPYTPQQPHCDALL